MPKLAATARFVLAEFGPLLVFWALALTLGVKPGMACDLGLTCPRCLIALP
jgi:hypothetical protein